jgi:rubrerythrin
VTALQEDWERNASEAERRAAAAVVDHNAASILCPACGHEFPTGPSECPDCGLGLV